MTEVLALIPARGGSKGIPGKNILPLAGKPVIYYTIDHAIESKLITRIVVSTDDSEIRDTVCGVYPSSIEVIMRPAEYATDTSPDIDTFHHALRWLWNGEGYMPQLVVHLRPTMPIRRDGDIDRAIQMMLAHPEADSLRSVSLAKESPYKMWQLGAGTMTPIYNDDLRTAALDAKWQAEHGGTNHGKPLYRPYCGEQHSMPRQVLPQVYHQNGYVDVIRAKTILDKRQMAGSVVLPFIVEHELYELDYLEDVERVENELYRLRGEGGRIMWGEGFMLSQNGLHIYSRGSRHAV